MSDRQRALFVAGASRGLGEAIVYAAARAGFRVGVAARSEQAIANIATSVDGIPLELDVRDADSCRRAVATFASECGGIDALVYNVGVTAAGPLASFGLSTWADTYDVNVLGAVRLVQAAIPHLNTADGSDIVTIGSTASLRGFPNVAPYVASKHALLGLTRALETEFGKKGVRCSCVCPGYIDTDMVQAAVTTMIGKGLDEAEALRRLLREQARLLTTEEVASAVLDVVETGPVTGSGRVVAIHPDLGPVDMSETEPNALWAREFELTEERVGHHVE
ncbi:MAG: SDR family oxidoreductase [Burkholderiales bacterium]